MKSNSVLCDFACERVAEAYLLYLMAIWRRPIYRYETGDIEVSKPFLQGLLDGYPKDRMTDSYRGRFYYKLLKEFDGTPLKGVVICGGKIPELSQRGIKYMNALLHECGDMLMDVGVTNANGVFELPSNIDEIIDTGGTANVFAH